jgi:hypothetical protein
MAIRFIEEVPSVYDYPTKEEMERNKKEHFWMVPKLFYVYSPRNSETSLEHVQRRHLYTKEANAYSVGKVALHIWDDEWDKDLFKTTDVRARIFLSKLNALTNKDPKKRPSLASVLDIFTSSPDKIELPYCCFHYEI